MKPYIKLLISRESKEVLGQHYANFWILALVLLATFLSIAFSSGSLNYLRYKMEDPFTQWVNISQHDVLTTSTSSGNLVSFAELLDSTVELKKKYHYNDIIKNQSVWYYIRPLDYIDDIPIDSVDACYVNAFFYENMKTPLIGAILNEDNIAEGCSVDTSLIRSDAIGVIITLAQVEKLGYDSNHLPAYINYIHHVSSDDKISLFDSLGIRAIDGNKYVFPLPVLAIVKKLPGNTSILASTFLYNQTNVLDQKVLAFNYYAHSGDTLPGHVVYSDYEYKDYLHSLIYYVADSIKLDDIEKTLTADIKLAKIGVNVVRTKDNEYPRLRSWAPGYILEIELGNGSEPIESYIHTEHLLANQFGTECVKRLYDIQCRNEMTPGTQYGISIEFDRLDAIHKFEEFAKSQMIQLEMAQVISKENFSAVSIMATILSFAMVTFAIICIIMFMVNMLQSYFQKVSRNIGTLTAFGMNADELVQTYVIILIATCVAALATSLIGTCVIAIILRLLGIVREAGYDYLSVCSVGTLICTLIVLIATVVTAIIVLNRLLSKTPGDLIYERG